MKFRLKDMKDIKAEEIPEMKAIADQIKTRNRPVFDIRETLTDKINIITELKHSSPSEGSLAGELDDSVIVENYIQGGASAVSVLTEKKFFGGSYEHLRAVSSSCSKPVLCKDFVYFEEQVDAAYLCGADMVLLISRILDRKTIKKLYDRTKNLGMTPLVEIHEKSEIENIMFLDPEFVLVNMRNLETLEMNPNTAIHAIKNLPSPVRAISASGISSPDDINYIMKECGVNSFLVGSSLMKCTDPLRKLQELKNVY